MSRDFFDEANWFSERFHGSKLSNDEIVAEFSVRGFESRVAMLHQIENYEDKGEVTRGDLRKASQKMALKRRLNERHHLQRLAGR
jgi:hypothetical protein